jgi:ureidoacrylate peracid hydrolase
MQKQKLLPCLSRRGFMIGTPVSYAVAESVTGFAGGLGMVNKPASVSHIISVEAKPDRVDLDLSKAGVLVVDMQNDFAAESGLVHRLGFDIQPIRATIPPIAQVLSAARASKLKIIYLKMGFQPDLSDLGSADSPNRLGHLHAGVGKTINAPNGATSRILIRDTWNTDIVSELKPHGDDVVLYKTRYSGFYNTELDATLKRHGINSLIVTGCTTSICVESTVRDAMFRDYRCLVLRDCVAEVIGNDLPRSNHEASLLLFEMRFGWVTESGHLVKNLKV